MTCQTKIGIIMNRQLQLEKVRIFTCSKVIIMMSLLHGVVFHVHTQIPVFWASSSGDIPPLYCLRLSSSFSGLIFARSVSSVFCTGGQTVKFAPTFCLSMNTII